MINVVNIFCPLFILSIYIIFLNDFLLCWISFTDLDSNFYYVYIIIADANCSRGSSYLDNDLRLIQGTLHSSWGRSDGQFSLQVRCIPLLQECPNASSRALNLLSAAMEIRPIQWMIGLNKYIFRRAGTTAKHVNTCWMPGTMDSMKLRD